MSNSMYVAPSNLLDSMNPWIHFIVTKLDNSAVSGILYSLLNTVIRYTTASWIPYDHMLFSHTHEQYVQVVSQVLLVLLNYNHGFQLAENNINEAENSKFRISLSKVNEESDFQMIVGIFNILCISRMLDGLHKLLMNPLQAKSSYLPNSVKELSFTEEIMILVWIFIDINEQLFRFICKNPNILDITECLIFQALSAKLDETKMGLLRMTLFILHMLSSDRNFSVLLNRPFVNRLPQNLELPTFNGCYGDLLIIVSLYVFKCKHRQRLLLFSVEKERWKVFMKAY